VKEALVDYEKHLAAKGTKPVSYKETIRRMKLFFSNQDQHVAGLGVEECERLYEAFRTRMVTIGKGENAKQRPISVDYQRNTLAEARSFLKWCIGRKYLSENPVDNIHGIGRRNQGKMQLTADEAKRWLRVALARVELGEAGPLAASMSLLMGLRASEITKRVVRDLDQEGAVLRISDAKTRKGNRMVAVPEILRPHLVALARDRVPLVPLFALEDGQPHLPSWIRFHTKRLCRLAKVPIVCAHGLRGTHASLAEAVGISSHAVANSLGHESVKTTHSHYTSPDAVAKAQQGRLLNVIQGGKR
jgi:integrase